ncbi:transglutaminase domain-containing protein [Pedobacter rhodius]|uniref:Transglutaminase-like domain-containing protein n=1 Tax=Pedobacter rhodius TaxID=3004098 RepID=A0ABT4KYR7_9SPHI|nr:transglutaminase domain-containing protein [Pedobacter sp. SJ11]MCZ4223994.1 hypothetical protein [Pedobacter sp. SJ11]
MNKTTVRKLNRVVYAGIVLAMLCPAICVAQEKLDYIKILKSGHYDKSEHVGTVSFQYQNSNDSALVALRNKYKLDSVSGFGNSQSRVLNVMHWVHNTLRHNGTEESGIKKLNADEILTSAKKRGIGVSCGELATVLNDCYLALGWSSKKIYCFPQDSLKNDPDSHVINAVYLPNEEKWIMVDPTNDAYVMDETGALLSIEEVRERIVNGKPLILNPDANWNRRISMTKENYLFSYMAKNLYRLYTPVRSTYDYESKAVKNRQYITLAPVGYKDSGSSFPNTIVNNPSLFWSAP